MTEPGPLVRPAPAAYTFRSAGACEARADFTPTSLYRAVSDRWGYNPDRYRQW